MKKERRFGTTVVCLLLLPLFAWLPMRLSPALALWADGHVGAPLRALLSRVSSFFPFSLTELTLWLLPVALLLVIPLAIRVGKSRAAARAASVCLAALFCGVMLLYVLTLGVGRCVPPLASRLGMGKTSPTPTEVVLCAEWLATLAEERGSPPPGEVSLSLLFDEYKRAGARYGFTANTSAPVKESATHLMARLGILGLYAFPYGEVTVSTDCPEASSAFTVAHELAHASGFSREEEADAIALLVSLDTKDAYLAGTAAEGMLARVLTALYADAPELWQEVSARLAAGVRRDIADANESYEAGVYAPAVAAEPPDCSLAVELAVLIYRARGRTALAGANIL